MYIIIINFQCTEDDHPDKVAITNAIRAMTDVATAINEYKRRKDLGQSVFLSVCVCVCDMLCVHDFSRRCDFFSFLFFFWGGGGGEGCWF